MSNPCHGMTGTDVDDAIQFTRYHLSPSERYGLAFLTSVCFHAMILWLVAQYLLKIDDDSAAPPKPTTIHLQLSHAEKRQSEPSTEQRPPTPSNTDRHETPDRSSKPQITEAPTTAKTRSTISSARILATARKHAKQIATEDTSRTGQNETPSQSALEKALNPQKEPAGVGTLTDGTIRVVTEFGFVYCIRPKDDSRILGPEDDLPMSVTCR